MNINSPICTIDKKSCSGYRDQNCIRLENCIYKSSFVLCKCKLKENFDCFYLSKDTKDFALRLLEPNLEKGEVNMIEDSDKRIVIEYAGYCTKYYNHWYVKTDGINFDCYTQKEFNEIFEL